MYGKSTQEVDTKTERYLLRMAGTFTGAMREIDYLKDNMTNKKYYALLTFTWYLQTNRLH